MILNKNNVFFVVGVIFIVAGIAGIFLPLVQGILLIFAGLFLISTYHKIKIVDDSIVFFKKLKRKF